MKTFTFLGCLLTMLLSWSSAQAQSKTVKPGTVKPAAAAAKPVAKPAGASASVASPVAAAPKLPETTLAAAPPSLITDKMETPAANTDALKVRAETNPLTKRLTVRTNAAGPTRVELNGTDGRPVITRDIMTGTDAIVLDISNLPAGSYIVQCSSGERRGMKRVSVGQ